MNDRRRAVAHRDHLAGPARFEARGHDESVRSRVDPAGHQPIESLDEGDSQWLGRCQRPEAGHQGGVAVALDDEPAAELENGRRGGGQQIEALLRVEAADHAEDRARVVRIEAGVPEQVPPAGELAGAVRPAEGRGDGLVRRRIPEAAVEPVENAQEAVALRPEHGLEAHPEGRRQGLGREAGADGVGQLRPLDPLAQQVDPVRVERDGSVARDDPELVQSISRDPAVVGKVVKGQDDRRRRDVRVVGVLRVAEDRGRRGVPVVEVDDIRRPALGPKGLEGRPAQETEAPRVVWKVVEAVAIEGLRRIDEAEAVAIRWQVDDRHLGYAADGVRIRDRDPPTATGAGRHGDAPVARQEYVDRRLDLRRRDLSECPSEGVDDVRETAGLGPRLALGGDERDTQGHRAMVRRCPGPGRPPGLLRPAAVAPDIMPTHMEPSVHVPSTPASSFRLPPRLEGLRALAYNLYWSWHPRAKVLFNRIDARAWQRYRNPIPVLSEPIDWTSFLDDSAFMAEYVDVISDFERYLRNGADHWFHRRHGRHLAGPIAYFCAEFGLYESLGIYSGGLGVLAGDHVKTASDMALPLVGVGLMYRKGYFRQTIDADGHQEHAYPDYDLSRLPISRVIGTNGQPLQVAVELPGRDLRIAVWCVQVGRVPVLLLDTDIPENDAADRPITHILYVRGREMRLHQELVLGVGGVRAIRALGISPAVWHLNEGHSALLLAERARELVAAGRPLDDAWQTVARNSVFTIHTPVSAGNERFDAALVRRVASPLLDGDGRPATGGIPIDRVLDLGVGPDGDRGQFDMTAFSLRLTNGANAVSELHAATANATWTGTAPREIVAVTNGIHGPTWLGTSIRELLERYLDADLDDLDPQTAVKRWWERLGRIPAAELWDAHRRQKRELALFAEGRLRSQFARHGESPDLLGKVEHALDPDALTIGFARRFATYKRAGMIFSDVDRLGRLVWDAERPVQVIFAGKAHPADRPGQGVIQEIFARTRSEQLRGRVFILEDYDMRIARFLVQGVDVWLNNPRRPLEASGTSGMKAAANGVVNVSVLDGWWDEGWTGDNGWAIGGRETNPDEGAQDWADAQALYGILEDDVVPGYYNRDERGLPASWVETMRRSMASTLWRFSTTRMLHEYTERLYLPAAGVEVARPALAAAITEAG